MTAYHHFRKDHMATNRATKETLYLRRDFTADERLDMGRDLAQAHNRLAAIDDEEKSMKATVKEKRTGVELTIGSLSRKLNDGYEMENQVCALVYDEPNVGEVTYKRPDGTVAKVRAMTLAERQEELPFSEAGEGPTVVVPAEQSAENIEEFFKPGRPTEQPTAETAAPIAEPSTEDLDAVAAEKATAEATSGALPDTFESDVRASMGVPEPFPATLEEQIEASKKVDTGKPKKKNGPTELEQFHEKQEAAKEKSAPKPSAPPAEEVW